MSKQLSRTSALIGILALAVVALSGCRAASQQEAPAPTAATARHQAEYRRAQSSVLPRECRSSAQT